MRRLKMKSKMLMLLIKVLQVTMCNSQVDSSVVNPLLEADAIFEENAETLPSSKLSLLEGRERQRPLLLDSSLLTSLRDPLSNRRQSSLLGDRNREGTLSRQVSFEEPLLTSVSDPLSSSRQTTLLDELLSAGEMKSLRNKSIYL